MTYEEFLKLIDKPATQRKPQKRAYEYSMDTKEIEDSTIQVYWDGGGYSGGSCWGSEARPHSGDPEPEFQELDEILEKVCPKIGFIEYKNLCSKLIHKDSYYKQEYYGNSSHHEVKWVVLKDLYNYLIDKKII